MYAWIKKIMSDEKQISLGSLCRLRRDKYALTTGWHEHRHRWRGNPAGVADLPLFSDHRDQNLMPLPSHSDQAAVVLEIQEGWIYYRHPNSRKNSKYYVKKAEVGYPKSVSRKRQLGRAILVQWPDGTRRYEFESDLETI